MRSRVLGALLVLSSLAGAARAEAPVDNVAFRACCTSAIADVRELQRAALRTAGVSVQNVRWRMHLSALLPQVSASVGRGLQVLQSARPLDGMQQVTLSDGDHFNYTITGRWDLSRLMYAREELALSGQAARAAQINAALTAEVARLYYERRTLLSSGEPGDEKRRQRIDELTATLDGLTGLSGLADLH